MAITSELLGKLGGADVEIIPVSVTLSSSSTNLYSGEVPAGETWVVFVVGDFDVAHTSRNNAPEIGVGDRVSRFGGHGGIVAEVTGDFSVFMRRNFSLREDTFVGNIYIAKD